VVRRIVSVSVRIISCICVGVKTPSISLPFSMGRLPQRQTACSGQSRGRASFYRANAALTPTSRVRSSTLHSFWSAFQRWSTLPPDPRLSDPIQREPGNAAPDPLRARAPLKCGPQRGTPPDVYGLPQPGVARPIWTGNRSPRSLPHLPALTQRNRALNVVHPACSLPFP
jgi:hypothetical protein